MESIVRVQLDVAVSRECRSKLPLESAHTKKKVNGRRNSKLVIPSDERAVDNWLTPLVALGQANENNPRKSIRASECLGLTHYSVVDNDIVFILQHVVLA